METLEPRRLLSSIPLPVIPTGSGHLFVATAAPYNAVGDGVTNDTAAIQQAINDCTSAGGGTVEIPVVAGTNNIYEFSTLTLASNINFQVDAGAELQALPMAQQAAGVKQYIYSYRISNFEITGGGIIDGNGGSGWWGTTSPPDLFRFNGVSTMLVQNVTLTNSPLQHMAFGHAGTLSNNDVTINGVTIKTPSTTPNTDGIDPAGTNFLIENCSISDGDDDIAVKPLQAFCGNITITNCTIGSGHGISIGGQTTYGLNGMTVTNCTFNGTTRGIRLKAGRGNGGLVENVSYSNITMTDVQYPVFIFSYYQNGSDTLPTDPSADPGQAINATTPFWQNITISNLTSTNTNTNSVAGVIYGLPEAPADDISFNNVNISANVGMEIDHARNVTFDNLCHITVAGGADMISSKTSPQFPTPYDATVLGAGFVNQDIGAGSVSAGTSSVLFDPDAHTWTIRGDGEGITGGSDQFNFSYESAAGDGSLTAELDSLTGVGGAVPQAGLMYRASTDANAPFVAVLQQTSNDNIILESRATSGSPIVTDDLFSEAGIGATYARLTRSGNTFSAVFGPDGVHWTVLGSVTIAGMPGTADAGLFATADSNGNLATAVFSSFSPLLTASPPLPPQVDNVVVDGSAWSPSFLTYLSGLNSANVGGYSIPTGSSAQLAALPWTNLDQISITFTQNVNVTQSSLQLLGVNVPGYSFSGFNYNASSDTATWTLGSPMGDERLLIDLGGSVSNSSGVDLDGQWTDGVSTYPSGNGTPGSPFMFSFNVLPGDVNQSGGVSILDTVTVASVQGSSTSTPATYSIFVDVNGSGGINVLDTVATNSRQASTLPSGTPAAPAVTTRMVTPSTSAVKVAASTVPTPTASLTVFSTTPITSSLLLPNHHKRGESSRAVDQ